MRKYELMTIFSTEDEKSKNGQEALRSVLGKYGVVIEKEEPYGDRDLTYEVKKQHRGRFILFTIKANPAKLVEIDRDFKLESNILKYLFVKIDEE